MQNNATQSDSLGVGSRSNCYVKIDNRYVIGAKINSGAFGRVHKVYDLKKSDAEYAAKIEQKKANSMPLLSTDFTIMKAIIRANSDALIPKIHYYGQVANSFVLIMDLMGPSVEDLFTLMNKRFSIKTILMLSLRMLRALETVHAVNFIHRDIKPDNFVMGGKPRNKNRCYLIDFGLSKRCSCSIIVNQTPRYPKRNLTGTVRYVSLNIHDGYDPTKWDDIQSLGYVFIYLLKNGQLPWMGLRAETTAEKYAKISEKKRNIPLSQICEGVPDVYLTFMQMIKDSSSVHQQSYSTTQALSSPDYVNFYMLFKNYATKSDISIDFEYDWAQRNYNAFSRAEQRAEDQKAKQAQGSNNNPAQVNENNNSGQKKVVVVSNQDHLANHTSNIHSKNVSSKPVQIINATNKQPNTQNSQPKMTIIQNKNSPNNNFLYIQESNGSQVNNSNIAQNDSALIPFPIKLDLSKNSKGDEGINNFDRQRHS